MTPWEFIVALGRTIRDLTLWILCILAWIVLLTLLDHLG